MPLIQWLEGTSFDAAIRNSVPGIRIAEIVHLIGLALFGGTTLLLNLTLFGFGPPRPSLSRIARQLLPWTVAGLVIMLLSGALLFLSSPTRFYENPALRVKIGILVPAMAFQFTIHRKLSLSDPPAAPRMAALVAGISTLLWIGAGFAGKAIGPFAVQ